jgi:polyhydroxyalkanoate synthase
MPLLPEHSAPQHERAPRPLPLFLELVREVAKRDPDLAGEALAGLRAYEQAPRRERPPPKPEIARFRGAALRDYGGTGAAVVLVPSLINPPRILDLDEDVSPARRSSRTSNMQTPSPAPGATRQRPTAARRRLLTRPASPS